MANETKSPLDRLGKADSAVSAKLEAWLRRYEQHWKEEVVPQLEKAMLEAAQRAEEMRRIPLL